MEGTNLPRPKTEPSPEQISKGHILKSQHAEQTRPSYWKALKSGWKRAKKKDYDSYRAKINKERQNKASKKSKGTETFDRSLNMSLVKSAKNKPTLTLPWIRHNNFSKFKTHFKQIGSDLTKHQGWYCLGTSGLLSYVGMVGTWNYQNDEMYNNTIWLRWTDESQYKGHDVEDKKWPKGLFQNDNLKIDGDKAKVHTCTIASVNPNKEMKSKNPPIYNRNWSQHKLIRMVEDALIFLPAQDYRITPGTLYVKRNDSFINKKSGGKPIKIKNKKAMINAQSVGTFPRTYWYLGGDFNIKCIGKMPSQLSSIFGGGIHVKSVIEQLQPRNLRDGPTK